MLHIDKIYINGEFVTPHGSETFALFNPATEEVIGQARLADEEDARRAIAAAKALFLAGHGRRNSSVWMSLSGCTRPSGRERRIYVRRL